MQGQLATVALALALAAGAAGGLMIAACPSPNHALADGARSLTCTRFPAAVGQVLPVSGDSATVSPSGTENEARAPHRDTVRAAWGCLAGRERTTDRRTGT